MHALYFITSQEQTTFGLDVDKKRGRLTSCARTSMYHPGRNVTLADVSIVVDLPLGMWEGHCKVYDKGTPIAFNQPLYYKSYFISTCLNTLSINLF